MRERHVVIAVYPGLQPLDAVGPFEVFAGATRAAASLGRAGSYRITLASAEGEPVWTESGLGLCTVPLPEPGEPVDTLLLPGGDRARSARWDTALLSWIGPVSYTHLDVYKRQARDNSAKSSLCDAICGGPALSVFMPCLSVGAPWHMRCRERATKPISSATIWTPTIAALLNVGETRQPSYRRHTGGVVDSTKDDPTTLPPVTTPASALIPHRSIHLPGAIRGPERLTGGPPPIQRCRVPGPDQ